MTKRKRLTFWDQLGLRLAAMPAGQRIGLAFIAFFVFAGASLVAVNIAGHSLADRLEPQAEKVVATEAGFEVLVSKATAAAYSAFFGMQLNEKNFISNFAATRTAGDRKWEYTFWDLRVSNEFDFELAKRKFAEKLAALGPTVHTEALQIDAKSLRLNIDIEGLNTHGVFLTRTAVEAEKESEAVFTLAEAAPAPVPGAAARHQIAIIIDDIGYRDVVEKKLLELDFGLTFSVLPHSPSGRNFASRARQKGREVMLHIPMEPKDPRVLPGQGGLFVRMADDEIRQVAAANLDDIPGISGVNNHMGSRFTSDESKMGIVLELVKSRNLYFVDSRTAGSSRAYEVAKRMGLRTGARNVFLDHDPDLQAVHQQLDVLLDFAKKHERAIAIGHPNDNTYKALAERLPEFLRAGIEIVPPSKLVR
ncbi:MAG: divergent polysaccharide deacetylase family protein [Deltaproteobacteria bacterium]|nr:divergent polysaccharide deacetylase family protein [Deltaproteobacteria bacterium]